MVGYLIVFIEAISGCVDLTKCHGSKWMCIAGFCSGL